MKCYIIYSTCVCVSMYVIYYYCLNVFFLLYKVWSTTLLALYSFSLVSQFISASYHICKVCLKLYTYSKVAWETKTIQHTSIDYSSQHCHLNPLHLISVFLQCKNTLIRCKEVSILQCVQSYMTIYNAHVLEVCKYNYE